MRYTRGKRILAMLLAIWLMVGTVIPHVEVEADALSVSSLTCSGFISNAIARSYIDTMMKYYINTYSKLQTALNNGKSVVFMFEGGSDNYWNGSTYADVVGDVRNQAVCIVVQRDSSGNCYIPFYSENCSSVPDDPQNCTYGVAYSGATTVKDGIHSFYTWNHTGPYGAFQLNLTEGYYTPSSALNGYTAGASGLNIHTRSTNTCGGAAAGWNWSLGCQVIGSGYYTGNEFNQFMKAVAGINYNVWLDYYNKSFNTISTGTDKGYYVVDRQLGQLATNGTKYGSGSLIALYNSTALTNISSFSTAAAKAAGALDFEYSTSQCTYYPSHCKIECTLEGAPINSQPCSVSTAYNSSTLETASVGDVYTATGIFKNHYGNYWYRVTTSGGKTGYIYGGECKYKEQILSDIKLTGAEPPNGHGVGGTWYVNGTISTKYNNLSSVSCYIYSGFGSDSEAVTGTSDTPTMTTSGISYVLKGSKVDDGTWMGPLTVGNYTYVLSATYLNYYTTSATSLASNSGTLTLMDEYFAVVQTQTNQSTCNHNNTTYVLEETTCTTSGATVTVCSICGRITESTTTGSHSYGSWTTTKQPTCTEEGVSSRTCSLCGDVQTQSISAKGHSYSTQIHASTCLEYERIEYTCGTCGHNYSVYANELMTEWSEVKPEGVDESLVETKTQYRYSGYETLTSAAATMGGYTQIGKKWVQSGSGTVQYVSGWPSGFDTGNSLYTKYNNSPVSSSETATAKTVADSGEVIGYLYYHWCRGTYTAGPINRTTSKTKDDTYTAFHSFAAPLSSLDPSTLTEASDGSVTYAHANACTDSWWWYYIPIYAQDYTNYTAEFTYERWTDWSAWSDTPVTATDTRKVETRALYRYVNAELGDHKWVEGVCSICGEACGHTYANGFCTVCGMAEPIRDYYLFGFINGANYGCEEDFTTIGEYLFVDDQLVVKFEKDSYVAVKSGDNNQWFMTDGWQGYDKTSAVLYNALELTTAEKLYVPGGAEIIFTLTHNDDGTKTLSYEAVLPALPTVTMKFPTLSFEDEIFYNVVFAVDNPDNVEITEMGLLTWTSEVDGTVEDAEYKIPGTTPYGSYFLARSQGIPAKNMSDNLYFKVYLKLADGSYAYGSLKSYSARDYALNQLKSSSSSDEMKALCVALLNYGAAAQEYFGYKTDALMNGNVTISQMGYVDSYSSDMLADVVEPSPDKIAALAATTDGYSRKYPAVDFGGAFSIVYNFTPAFAVEGDVKLYVWDTNAYNVADTLSLDNASDCINMTAASGGYYIADVSGIAAKDIDETIYVCGIYESGGVSYCTGVLAYSLGAYCKGQAGGTTAMQTLAAATAVYSYYAKIYLSSI